MPEIIPVIIPVMILWSRSGLFSIIIIGKIIYGIVGIVNYLFEVDIVNSPYNKPQYKQGYSH